MKRIRSGRRNTKGFTLVELCVVISITAIIVTMICTFLATYSRTTFELENRSKELQDLTNVQAQINNWVIHFDSSYYDISVSGSGLSAAGSALATEKSITTTPGSLTYADGTLTDVGYQNTVVTYQNVADIAFAYAKDGDVAEDGTVTQLTTDNTQLIVCTVTTDSGKTQKFIFSRQSNTSRNRYFSGSRIDLAKIETATVEWLAEQDSSTVTVSGGKLTSDEETLGYQTVDGSKRMSWLKKDGSRKKYYGLVSATGASYSISGSKITCTVTFTENGTARTETLEWVLG